MNAVVREAVVKILESLKGALENGTLYNTDMHGTRITSVSAALESKLGVLVGETIESSLMQLYLDMRHLQIDEDGWSREAHAILPFVDALLDSLKSGNEISIFAALSELRYHATRTQHELSSRYRARPFVPRR